MKKPPPVRPAKDYTQPAAPGKRRPPLFCRRIRWFHLANGTKQPIGLHNRKDGTIKHMAFFQPWSHRKAS
jgi:hypothetical protein